MVNTCTYAGGNGEWFPAGFSLTFEQWSDRGTNKTMVNKRFSLSTDQKRLADNVLSLWALQAANYLLPLIAVPYLVRTLGADKFGAVMFAQAFIQYFILFTDFGFNLSAPREIAIHRDSPQTLQRIFNGVLINKLFLSLVAFGILITLVHWIPRFAADPWLYYLSFGIVIGNALFPQWFFQGMERMRFITALNILSKSIFTLSIFFLVHQPNDYLWVPILNATGYGIAAGVGIFIALYQFRMQLAMPGGIWLFRLLKESSQFFLSRISVSIYTTSNAFVLGLFNGNTIVGYYTAAEKLYIALQAAYQPLVNALYPYVARYRNNLLYKKIFYFAVGLNVLICIGLWTVAPWLIARLYGENMDASITVFRLLIVIALVVVPSILIGYPYLAALGYPRDANGTVMLGSVVHICGLVILIALNQVNLFTVPLVLAITESTVLLSRVMLIHKRKLWRNT